jgi:two-component system, chemotaxis family, response regulator Rcp1
MFVSKPGGPILILLVEDNPGDVRLTQEVLNEAKIANKLQVVKDGEEALNYLQHKGKFANAEVPNLILLDLNLPRKNGLEVLREIKQDPQLRRIPVVFLTSSGDERDINAGYEQHVNAYVTKPVDLEQFIRVVKAIEGFWLEIVRLPPSGEG